MECNLYRFDKEKIKFCKQYDGQIPEFFANFIEFGT